MKKVLRLPFLALGLAVLLISCGNDSEVRQNAADTIGVPSSENSTTPVPAAPAATPAPGGTVFHYTCPNNHGGAEAQGTCPQCGAAYVHNQAWHNQPQNASPTTPTTTPTTTPNQDPSPAQNAAGVWHYTCNNGCAGGAGSAGNCSNCGSPLAHNTAYHN